MIPRVDDLAVLARLFEGHQSRLLAILSRRIDPTLCARLGPDDILHDAYIEAQRRWPSFAVSGMSPFAWLYRIALDCLMEAWRRETRGVRDVRKDLPLPDRSSMQLGLNLVGSLTSPSEALSRSELKARVRQVMEALRPTDREILWVRHFDQLTFREAAEAVGLSENAVIQRHLRALKRFKALWDAVGAPERGVE